MLIFLRLLFGIFWLRQFLKSLKINAQSSLAVFTRPQMREVYIDISFCMSESEQQGQEIY